MSINLWKDANSQCGDFNIFYNANIDFSEVGKVQCRANLSPNG
jgi:hypothetical protein